MEGNFLNIWFYNYYFESADFVWIKTQTGLIDGNLSSHLSKLETADYAIVEKRVKNKKPNTFTDG